MAELAEQYIKDGHHVVADFICPTPETRKLFNPDYIVWVDTIQKGRFDDTNEMFVKPEKYKKECHYDYLVTDYICPTPKTREIFNPDYIVWVDTINKGRFEDTNKMFVKPKKFDFKVTSQNAELWALQIAEQLIGPKKN